jgi:4-hydroxybutyrate dehydrogenase/sulfolactaldehyde 3-reductase
MQNTARSSGADEKIIGFVGLGRMGFALASNLSRNGFSLCVYDISETRMQDLEGASVRRAQNAAEVARESDIVFMMLPGPKQVIEVALGDDGIFANARSGATIVDMSTVDTGTVDRLATAAAERGLSFADAPVGRLAAHADKGQSLFMVGASSETLATIHPVLMAMGTTVHHCGAAGHGTRTKLVNNFLVLSYCQLNSEALVLSDALGLDLEQTLDVLLGTTAANGQLRDKWPVKVLRGDTTPGFDIVLGLKDLTLACQSAEHAGVSVALGERAKSIFEQAIQEGYGGQDTSALTDHWAKLNARNPLRLPEKV